LFSRQRDRGARRLQGHLGRTADPRHREARWTAPERCDRGAWQDWGLAGVTGIEPRAAVDVERATAIDRHGALSPWHGLPGLDRVLEARDRLRGVCWRPATLARRRARSGDAGRARRAGRLGTAPRCRRAGA